MVKLPLVEILQKRELEKLVVIGVEGVIVSWIILIKLDGN